MQFPDPLIEARLIKRYKRFLADMELADGSVVTAHCANPGSMMGLNIPGARCWLSPATNPKRKLRYSWELIEIDDERGKTLVGINTSHPNKLAEEAITAGRVLALTGYANMRREVKYGKNSRIDILLEDDARPDCLVEVKNVHLVRKEGLVEFPDSVTARGAKHLHEMADQVADGKRAVMLYLIQWPGVERFKLARDLDPTYAAAFDEAIANGVEAHAIACRITTSGIEAHDLVPIDEAVLGK